MIDPGTDKGARADARLRADEVPGYVAKYGALIERLGADPASFAGEYAVPIRITPTKLRQWRSASAD